MDVRAAWRRIGARCRNAGRPGNRVLRALRGRPRAVGPEGAPARRAARRPPRRRPRPGADLRQRRLLLVLATSGCASSSAAGPTQGIPRVKMKVGREPERDPRAARRGPRGDRRRRRALCATRTAPSRARRRSAWAERYAEPRERDLVRGAGLLRRPRGPAPPARRRRRRGSRSRPASTPTSRPTSAASSRLRRLPPGRRHPLRRHHRPPRGVRPRERALDRRLRPLRARDLAPMPSAPSSGGGTSSTSTTTSGSSGCSSTASSSRRTACSGPTARGRGTGSSSSAGTRLASASSSRR